MRRDKIGISAPQPSKVDGMFAGTDETTNRFRHFITDEGLKARPDRILASALNYAVEAENRIAELNARIAQLENMAITDDLTGLLNRRGFDSILQRNLMSAARYEESGILAYFDLNNFKGINDRHGHTMGDEVLRAVGRHLQQSVRATDYAARLGGDEFAILFVRAQQTPARERARQLVRGLSKLGLSSPVGKISVRASLGIASYDSETQAHDLLERADRAMYADKNKGSNASRLIING
ncbi:MAG: GGDEF domain-containing protein [Parvibaculaceae bacterium]